MGGVGGPNEMNAETIADMIANGWCPYCTDPEGPASQERTLVDHCAERKANGQCPEGWSRCERCKAYGVPERFARPRSVV